MFSATFTNGLGTRPRPILYGYRRPCGRVVLVTGHDERDLDCWELVAEGEAYCATEPQLLLHDRMLRAEPGSMVRYHKDLRKLTAAELAVYDGAEFLNPARPDPDLLESALPVAPPHIHALSAPELPIETLHDPECPTCEWA